MQTEPPKAEPPKRKRRWFQFRLRTLMTVVTIFCVVGGYVAHEAKITMDRKAMLETGSDGPVVDFTVDKSKDAAIPSIRLWIGDHFFSSVHVKQQADINRYKAAFPEADVELPPPPQPTLPW
jgi:hypothetical protein